MFFIYETIICAALPDGKHFPSVSYFAFLPFCMRQRAITTLSLNACWNQMLQELSFSLTNCIMLA